jgi:hypothetical protein
MLGGEDEVKIYLDSHWIGACKSFWRFMEYELHVHNPNVIHLPVHEEGMHHVVVNEDDVEEILRQNQQTKLTAYFAVSNLHFCVQHQLIFSILKANSNPDIRGYARHFLYQKFPQHFVWVNHTKTWRPCYQQLFAIGHMYSAPKNHSNVLHFSLHELIVSWEHILKFPKIPQICVSIALTDLQNM